MQTDKELIDCPFCGCEAWIVEDRGDHGTEKLLYRPQCKMCGASLGGFDYRDNAIMVWNRRDRLEALSSGEAVERFWLVIRNPGCLPQRKGPWRVEPGVVARTLRDFMTANPTAYVDLLTIGHDGPDVQHGPEALQMLDGRSMARGRRHNAQTREAHAAYHAAPRPMPGREWIAEQAALLSSAKDEDSVGALAWNLTVAFRRWSDSLFSASLGGGRE